MHQSRKQESKETNKSAEVRYPGPPAGKPPDYSPNDSCPFMPELRTMLAKTVGLAEKVRGALAGLETEITVSFICGSIAVGNESSTSDIDLMLIGLIWPRSRKSSVRRIEAFR